MKKDYFYSVLSPEELRLLMEWRELTGESLDKTRVKLMDPEQRSYFIDEVSLTVQQKKATIESLLEAFSKIKKGDSEKKSSDEK